MWMAVEPATYAARSVPAESASRACHERPGFSERRVQLALLVLLRALQLLAANDSHAGWLSAEQLVDLYLAEKYRPVVIDCSGGQPDLIPEWVPWMMTELRRRNLADSVYLWSDDNLSNDFFWRYLSPAQRRDVAGYRNYGRVCCFKGFNAESFAFNTKADQELFDRQFELFAKLLALDLDLYAYATFTAPTDVGLIPDMANFVDRLQGIHRNLPLRLVPLRIENYGVVQHRIGPRQQVALAIQEYAISAWNEQIEVRFQEEERWAPRAKRLAMGLKPCGWILVTPISERRWPTGFES